MTRELKQKVALNDDGIGYYVLEREHELATGEVVTVVSQPFTTEQDAEIIRLRTEMVPFAEIAEKFGMTAVDVTKRFYLLMNRDYEQLVDSMNAMRYSELLLLEGQIKNILDLQKSMPDGMHFVDRLIALLNRRSKLLGLDAPERFQAQVQISSYEEQLQALDAEYVEVISEALNAEHRKRKK